MMIRLSLDEISDALKEKFPMDGGCVFTWSYDNSGNLEGVEISNEHYLNALPKPPQPPKAIQK